jgi:hypothetical protein
MDGFSSDVAFRAMVERKARVDNCAIKENADHACGILEKRSIRHPD